MKFLKYAMLTLVVAIATDIVITSAAASDYPSPNIMQTGVQEIAFNQGYWTRYLTKNTWTAQKYYHDYSATWLTSPCPKCQIATKPGTESGDLYSGVVTVMGQTKTFTDPTSISSPDVYKLYIYRFDTTVLTTNHAGAWTINGQ